MKRRPRILCDFAKLALMKYLRIRRKGSVNLVGYNIRFGDIDLLYQLFIEVFVQRSYYFDCSYDVPVIVDAGANIGIATLFFKYQYPNSIVICFEPDRINFGYLKSNVESNGLDNIELNNTALHDYDGSVSFYVRNDIEGGDIGASVVQQHRYLFHDERAISRITVPCERLSRHLENKARIDLLKIDVEGNESRVSEEISGSFSKIKNMIMEYHYIPSENPLSNILSILDRNDHIYSIDAPRSSKLFWGATLLIKSKKVSQVAW
jgi:FkbM family methyltransferase